MKMDLDKSAQYVKGVGPTRYRILNRLGVYTVGDLLYYFPRRYEDRRNFSTISRLAVGTFATVRAQVFKPSIWRSKKGMSVFQVAVNDESGVLVAVWFNQPFLKKYFKIGQEVILYGKVEKFRHLQMNSPEFEFVSGSVQDDSLHIGRIVPIYPLTANINQRYLRTIINRAQQAYQNLVGDALPEDLRLRLGLLTTISALRNIHFPEDFPQKEAAYRRLVFDEFFILQLILALKKHFQGQAQAGIAHKVEGDLSARFLQALPFKLTAAQGQAVKEIAGDMRQTKPMHRLLQGEVGSGKTIVAAYALILSVQSGFQAVLMAPTEILAEQHYLVLSKLLLPLGINLGMLIGSMSSAMKSTVISDIESGAVNIVIGTHALLEESIRFKKLGLAVIDEQHKFGVAQRAILHKKGYFPDCLVMTATPIPRTLAMTVYGDLDISTIRELPKGRLPVSTICLKPEAAKEAYKFIREEVAAGHQAYIVYPLIKQNAAVQLKAAVQMYEQLSRQEFPQAQLGLIHGRLKTEEKEQVMSGFKQGKIDILVSTTVIEVGIDMPNATVMVIEQAERFGLSQLHQLRGRIGRGKHPSCCILIAEPQTENSRRRLEAMLTTQDGFELAQQDLDIRGPGQFFGLAQHGLPELRIGNIIKDMEIMELARKQAIALINSDPRLQLRQHLLLRQQVTQRLRTTNLGLLWA